MACVCSFTTINYTSSNIQSMQMLTIAFAEGVFGQKAADFAWIGMGLMIGVEGALPADPDSSQWVLYKLESDLIQMQVRSFISPAPVSDHHTQTTRNRITLLA